MHESLVLSVDVGRFRTRGVLLTSNGIVLDRYTWTVPESRWALPASIQQVQVYYGVPVVLTGRVEVAWPEGLLEALATAGVSVDLHGGREVARMLRLERRFREDPAYRSASLLAAIRRERLCGGVERPRSFVLNWCMEEALRQLEALMIEDVGDSAPGWLSGKPPHHYGDWARCAIVPSRRSVRS